MCTVHTFEDQYKTLKIVYPFFAVILFFFTMINEIGEIRPNNTTPVLMMEKYFGEEGRIDRKTSGYFIILMRASLL